MATVTVLLLSTDGSLADVLASSLGEAVVLEQCHHTRDVRPVVGVLGPRVACLDFRRCFDGGHSAAELLDDLHATYPELSVLLLTDTVCPETIERRIAARSLRQLRNPTEAAIIESIQNSLPQSPDNGSPEAAEHHYAEETDAVLEGVTRRFETKAPQLKRMLEDLAIAAVHDVTILLIGETGSGKTYLSNLIHEASPRRDEPFIHVACGALPRELIESELFGHVKGAFTSAHADKDGKFVAAGRGTILLDEIDVLGPEQQVKLLRVIETGEFEQVGSNRTLKSKARLVVASNLDLQPLVEQGRFRPDLYYRLNMLKFDIPPLRARKVDILPLARKFIDKFALKHGVQIDHTDDGLFDALMAYPWPGNVRELEHVVQRAVIYSRGGLISQHNLPHHILAGNVGPTNDPSIRLSAGNAPDPTLGQQIALTERDIIEQALFRNNFSRTQTARDLGISRVTLYNKMRKYEMLK
ncbi:MAG: sigma 54-interacting transcriptional regulator [Planctomycetaceae bacterium]